jgi:hypothetical protein
MFQEVASVAEVEESVEAVEAPAIKMEAPVSPVVTPMPAPPQAAAIPATPAEHLPAQDMPTYYPGQVASNPPQFPVPAQQAIPPTVPATHRSPQPHPRPVTEVIDADKSSFNFLQDSQVEMETPANVDLAVMLQYPANAGPAPLPPGRNPAAPAASAVPQPEFHQAIPTQTFTNQNFPVIGQMAATAQAPPPTATPVVAAAHIPAYPAQQPAAPPATYHPQEMPTPVPIHVVEEQVQKMQQSASAPPQVAPASFAQAAQSYSSQAHAKTYSSGAPPGFSQKMPQQNQIPQQSHFQPLPTQEQVEEQDQAEEHSSWANEGQTSFIRGE